uniref:Uncharacterized protein n=1 Tax=Cannabis sativa TaxID=3483 RepID=A0A803PGA5_CANSA
MSESRFIWTARCSIRGNAFDGDQDRRIASSLPQSRKWRLQLLSRFNRAHCLPLIKKGWFVSHEPGQSRSADSESTVGHQNTLFILVHASMSKPRRWARTGDSRPEATEILEAPCSRSALTTTMHDLEVAGTQVNSVRTPPSSGELVQGATSRSKRRG